ncbi:aldolase [Rhodococcus sp. 15-725-2-2b]|jgi:2-keto-3-deoxy-L-rhamnonate aldolase RhmA|uniref:HpcH/HpaI aldolase family protein n=2 Tax=Mycobacteriales TaxID=85007 RepID=UPI000562CC8D|nr:MULTISPECIES: aldolase/citrate lyase family protein [unclassified Rhodococcus (in: high G+C Gram-positive bacteria)]OZC61919.1 aldolase [Rhodococcus sp. 06-470-2]OZC64583.1 aldolase [Rhodococcus sp. 06-469-3-2]OZC87982.1 aldolase [Rhodococcus sp. 06-418-1B]OZD51217.1 aldolase [Rhodococcus sp. 06-1477-1A]OZE58048.1 aldolase [Rhodococcus sp. 05-2221-1B]OZE71656.1 aldolase [Rhodococcus sp. 15-725-2-2b]OZE85914.1 aldolase [Rhodococcus sp. 15-649-1-2]
MSDETPVLLHNFAKEKLSRGEPVYSMTVRLVRTIDIASIAHTAGFDTVYIDLEHSSFSLQDAGQICMACNHLGVTPLVRVPDLDPALIARVMDSGAMGIVVPGVASADEARAAVRAVKHAPLGERSLAGAAPQLHYRTLPAEQVVRELDQASMVIVMIESQAGLDAAEDIAAVDGVDVVLVGANDLSVELGVAGQVDHPKIHEAYLRVIAACKAGGKTVGIGGMGGRPDLIRQYLDMGAGYVSTGNDISFLAGAAAQKRQQFS